MSHHPNYSEGVQNLAEPPKLSKSQKRKMRKAALEANRAREAAAVAAGKSIHTLSLHEGVSAGHSAGGDAPFAREFLPRFFQEGDLSAAAFAHAAMDITELLMMAFEVTQFKDLLQARCLASGPAQCLYPGMHVSVQPTWGHVDAVPGLYQVAESKPCYAKSANCLAHEITLVRVPQPAASMRMPPPPPVQDLCYTPVFNPVTDEQERGRQEEERMHIHLRESLEAVAQSVMSGSASPKSKTSETQLTPLVFEDATLEDLSSLDTLGELPDIISSKMFGQDLDDGLCDFFSSLSTSLNTNSSELSF